MDGSDITSYGVPLTLCVFGKLRYYKEEFAFGHSRILSYDIILDIQGLICIAVQLLARQQSILTLYDEFSFSLTI